MKKLTAAVLACLILLVCTTTAFAETMPGMTSKVDYDNTDPNRYNIEVDVRNAVITVYEGEAIILQSLCTSGGGQYPTSSGVYPLGDLKERFGYFVAFGQYAQYWSQVVRGIYIHSILYDDKNDLSTISDTAYKNLGRNVSHGCIRVLPDVAQWIFYNCPPGTLCSVTRAKARDNELREKLRAEMKPLDYYKTLSDDTHSEPLMVPAVITSDSARLRSGFNGSDRTVASLSEGDKVLLSQISEKWCKAHTLSGRVGYVKTAYVYCEPDSSISSSEGTVICKDGWLYSSMKESAEVRLARLVPGDGVSVTVEAAEGWYFAVYDGLSGFIQSDRFTTGTVYSYPEAPEKITPSPGYEAAKKRAAENAAEAARKKQFLNK